MDDHTTSEVRRRGGLAAETARLRDELARSEARFRDVIERNADAIVVVDREGVVRFANAAAERLFGRCRGDLIGSQFGFPLVAGETTELDLPTPDGSPPVVEMRVVESEWEGRPACIASMRDISERKQAERRERQLIREQAARSAAERAARRFAFLAECSTTLAASLENGATLAALARLCVSELADWAVVYVVEEGGRVSRLEAAHRDPQRADDVRRIRDYPVPPQDTHPVLEVLRTGEPLLVSQLDDERLEGMTQDPEHLALVRRLGATSVMLVPMLARDRPVGAIALVSADPEHRFDEQDLSLARDLALRAALAVDNARLYREAREANRAKSDFLAVISHDLRTPLSAIIGYADLLLAGIPEPIGERSHEQVERLRTAGRHLLYLIDELLAFARLDAGHERVEPRDLTAQDIAREVAEVVEPLAREHGLAFELEAPERPVTLRTDAGKLRQVLVNLAGNAVKFTDDGRVVVEVAEDGDGTVEFRVRDTGRGIAEEHLEQIFQPFWQVERKRESGADGTGLGLSVVRRLVSLLGGRISVQSVVGEGSTFTVRLPRRPLAPAAAELDAGRGLSRPAAR